jgi:predicted component of type VI protein secretion system
MQALAVDQRLARIERQIQDQNAAYEQRIAELTTELNTARSENRELIRARIAQVKAEMLKARERLMAQAQPTGPGRQQ